MEILRYRTILTIACPDSMQNLTTTLSNYATSKMPTLSILARLRPGCPTSAALTFHLPREMAPDYLTGANKLPQSPPPVTQFFSLPYHLLVLPLEA